jgi:hypothetical protein
MKEGYELEVSYFLCRGRAEPRYVIMCNVELTETELLAIWFVIIS